MNWNECSRVLWDHKFAINDRPKRRWRIQKFQARYELMKLLNPKSIFEIGVGAGYHAFTMLAACPDATYVGWDIDDGRAGRRKGWYKHAEALLSKHDFQFSIEIWDSQTEDEFPGVDLIHVDGDHTFDGATHDMEVARQCAPIVLVDDYPNIQAVQDACEQYRINHPNDLCLPERDTKGIISGMAFLIVVNGRSFDGP